MKCKCVTFINSLSCLSGFSELHIETIKSVMLMTPRLTNVSSVEAFEILTVSKPPD